ncbi:MAG: 2-phospho-L-lactate transferase [Acidimicrobiales bacterium]|nr:2-phospho-L-lactate transferase [Acidimicrobiales bacterium]
MVTVISGGVGAARLLQGLHRRIATHDLIAVVNVADDMVLHGLHISPDLDTITYTLANEVSTERGWGLEGESWQAMKMVGHYGGQDWFSLGDRDLGTHLYRTQRLNEGVPLSTVTAEIARAWGLDLTIIPVTNNPVRTMVTLAEGPGTGEEIGFQEYFVGRQHDIAVSAVRFDGIESSHPAEGVEAALDISGRIIIAPSNPVVSVDPVLAIPGIRDHMKRRRDRVIGISPIIGGKALKGPAARLMTEMGFESSAVGVAKYYQDICGTLVIDTADAALAPAIEALGVRCVVTDTVMSEPGVLDALCDTILDL